MSASEHVETRRRFSATQSGIALALASFITDASDFLERFRAFAQEAVHPTDLNETTRQILAVLSGATATRTALQKAVLAHERADESKTPRAEAKP